MADLGNLEEWKMPLTVVGFTNIPPWTGSNGSQQLFIPALMPFTSMGQGKPKSISVGLDKSCFCNDNGCKPAVSSKISIQNYITVSPKDHESFSHSVFYPGSRILIDVDNADPERLKLSVREDNSSEPP